MTDPRTFPGFRPELYPRLEGAPAPTAAQDTNPALARKLAVLAAYYQINLCYQRLLAARKAGTDERSALQELEKALLARDRLDDEFAVYGLVSSPEVVNGIIANVKFTAPGKTEPRFSAISMCFAVTPP